MSLRGTENPEPTPAGPRRPRRAMALVLGLLGVAGYATHAGYHILTGHPEDVLWICHVSALLIGLGLIAGSPLLNAAGLLCATLGLPSWLLYLLSGEPLIPTSLLTHVLGPALGLWGIRHFGFPRSAWWVAWILVGALTLLSRVVTPAAANVNLAFGPIKGLSLWSVGGPAHAALWMGQWALGLTVTDFAYRWILRRVGWIRSDERPVPPVPPSAG